MQNSANKKNEIDFPERGAYLIFLLEAETVMNQLQQERYTGKGGIYSTRKLELACRKNIDFIWLLQGREGAGLLFVCPVPKRKGERSSIRLALPVCKTACRTGRNRIRRSLYRRHKDREHSESVCLSLLHKREQKNTSLSAGCKKKKGEL